MEYDSFGPDDTYDVAQTLGKSARAGDVICLIGDLGVGKTLFSQGFANGLEIKESVSSPTFTIVQQYDEGRLPLYHFDVYRIEDSDEMEEVGFTDMLYGKGVCLIEWADQISDILPEHYTKVIIDKNLDRGFDYRRIRIENI